jgi:hypothetical protein
LVINYIIINELLNGFKIHANPASEPILCNKSCKWPFWSIFAVGISERFTKIPFADWWSKGNFPFAIRNYYGGSIVNSFGIFVSLPRVQAQSHCLIVLFPGISSRWHLLLRLSYSALGFGCYICAGTFLMFYDNYFIAIRHQPKQRCFFLQIN